MATWSEMISSARDAHDVFKIRNAAGQVEFEVEQGTSYGPPAIDLVSLPLPLGDDAPEVSPSGGPKPEFGGEGHSCTLLYGELGSISFLSDESAVDGADILFVARYWSADVLDAIGPKTRALVCPHVELATLGDDHITEILRCGPAVGFIVGGRDDWGGDDDKTVADLNKRHPGITFAVFSEVM